MKKRMAHQPIFVITTKPLYIRIFRNWFFAIRIKSGDLYLGFVAVSWYK